MKVLVLGAGVIGTASAYYLAKAGHEVTVLERFEASALDTSYANAGEISPGYASPWAAPGVPMKALKWMFQEHSPLAIKPDGSLFQLRWMMAMLRNCNADKYKINKERMVRLADYSQEVLKQLRLDTGISYEGREKGTLQLFRTEKDLASARKDMLVLEQAQVPYRLLMQNELHEAEPALERVKEKFTGALHLPEDETGDCHIFTQRLTDMAKALGVKFLFNHSIEKIISDSQQVRGVICGDGEIYTADAYLMALGSYSTKLLEKIIELPVYPMKGYSITVPVQFDEYAPVSTILDESYKTAITRFDHRIRVGGMAELMGYDKSLNDKRKATLEMVLNDVFPQAGDMQNVEFWTGLRPKTPDSTPIVGETRLSNLYLNTGHGTLGWTMSCGSAQLIADLISGKTPAIRSDDLSIKRYSKCSMQAA